MPDAKKEEVNVLLEENDKLRKELKVLKAEKKSLQGKLGAAKKQAKPVKTPNPKILRHS